MGREVSSVLVAVHGREVLVPAYAAVRGRSSGHIGSGGPLCVTDYPRTDEFGGLSDAGWASLAGPASAAGRRSQFCREEPHMTVGRCP
jgi:hypothetical protein